MVKQEIIDPELCIMVLILHKFYRNAKFFKIESFGAAYIRRGGGSAIFRNCLLLIFCHYLCKWLAGKTHFWNYLV